ncbi:MAG: hypothetical protein QOE04_134 [Mycobacterium sp.]|nr:hypothetical protein [Mycobacterium sp.]
MSYRGARPASIATTGTALVGAVLPLALLAMGATVHAAPARADQVAYLVNVTVRPGYDLPTPTMPSITGTESARRSPTELLTGSS